jgi:hypothetical protein
MITPNYKLDLIDSNIISLTFDTFREQSITLFRMSEFYESPFSEIRGQKFSIDNFLYHYMNPKGKIKYFSFWDAYNIPGESIYEFFNLFYNEFTQSESELFDRIDKLVDLAKPFYLISALKGRKSDFEHELCHAKYYLDEKYRDKVDYHISHMPLYLYDEFKANLVNMGYSNDDSIIIDEINAYLSTSSGKYVKNNFVSDYEIEKYQKKLKHKFKKIKKSIKINTII